MHCVCALTYMHFSVGIVHSLDWPDFFVFWRQHSNIAWGLFRWCCTLSELSKSDDKTDMAAGLKRKPLLVQPFSTILWLPQNLYTLSKSLYIQGCLEPSSDTWSKGFELINGFITLMTDNNKMDSLHTVVLHHHNSTHKAWVCTLKACYNLIWHQVEWVHIHASSGDVCCMSD